MEEKCQQLAFLTVSKWMSILYLIGGIGGTYLLPHL